MFWAIYLYDVELLRPPELKKLMEEGVVTIPFWFSHSYHTTIVIFPVIDYTVGYDSQSHKVTA